MYQLYRDRPFLVLLIILANIALTTWCLNLDPVINNDGVTYITLAQLMLDGNWSSAFEVYSWPYYSAFIAGIAKLTFLEIEHAAFFLNTLLAISLTFAFVCVVAELSNNNSRVIVIATLVIVFFPSITKYRSFIIRDFGYLSCYLWSLYFLFKYCNTGKKSDLASWCASVLLSCLFRFEGIAFLLIAPYFLFLFTPKKSPHHKAITLTLTAVLVLVSISLATWYLNDKYAGLIEIARASGKDVHNAYDLFLAQTREQLSGEELTAWGLTGVIVSNFGAVFYELIRRMAVLYFFFALYSYIKGNDFKNVLVKQMWLVYVLSNLSLLMAYSLYNNFLVSRYTMATALTLLLLSPLVINRMIDSIKQINHVKRGGVILMLSLLALSSIEGLDVKTNKNHIKQSGQWIKQQLSESSRIFSNDPLIVYYAGRDSNERLNDAYTTPRLKTYLGNNRMSEFDYVALSTKPSYNDEETLRKTLEQRYGAARKIINGVDRRQVHIYKISR